MPDGRQLLPIATVADLLDVSPKTLRRMVREQRFPRPIRVVQGHPRWSRTTVQKYLDGLELGILIDGREEAEGLTPEPKSDPTKKRVKGKTMGQGGSPEGQGGTN